MKEDVPSIYPPNKHEKAPRIFTIPANMVNECERYYKLDLTPLGIKKHINETLEDLDN